MGNRRKEAFRLFARQKRKTICLQLARHRNYRQVFNYVHVTAEKRKTACPKKLPPHFITAEKIPPYFGLPLPPKSLPPKNKKTPTAQKLPPYCVTAEKILPQFRLPPPPQSLPPKTKSRHPPTKYRRMAIPPRLCPPKKTLPTTTLVTYFQLFVTAVTSSRNIMNWSSTQECGLIYWQQRSARVQQLYTLQTADKGRRHHSSRPTQQDSRPRNAPDYDLTTIPIPEHDLTINHNQL